MQQQALDQLDGDVYPVLELTGRGLPSISLQDLLNIDIPPPPASAAHMALQATETIHVQAATTAVLMASMSGQDVIYVDPAQCAHRCERQRRCTSRCLNLSTRFARRFHRICVRRMERVVRRQRLVRKKVRFVATALSPETSMIPAHRRTVFTQRDRDRRQDVSESPTSRQSSRSRHAMKRARDSAGRFEPLPVAAAVPSNSSDASAGTASSSSMP
jgi:hypothetical protein